MNVSRETQEMLGKYAEMIKKWNPSINLISRNTTKDMYERHFMDSLQVLEFTGIPLGTWVDLGSGGGLPGLIIAIDAKANSLERLVVLVEADQRKATFLREVIRTLGLNAEVIAKRIEDIPPLSAKVVSARALAPLPNLCALAARHLAVGGIAIFHKGENHSDEISSARKEWRFDLCQAQSITNQKAAILYLKDLSHA